MTTPGDSLPPLLLARDQAALVATDEAKARQAAADADTSTLTKYKSLVPDLSGTATNTVTDNSTGAAFSGLVTYSALNHAAELIADRIGDVLTDPAEGTHPVILVTSQSDLLTNDLLAETVSTSLTQLIEFADQVLTELEKPDSVPSASPHAGGVHVAMLTADPTKVVSGVGAAAVVGGATAVLGLGPVGLAAAAAAAIPAIISLFTTSTTVRDHSEDITDLAATTAVLAAVSEKLNRFTVVHEDFRRAPVTSLIRDRYAALLKKRMALVFDQEEVQTAKNNADLELARAQQQQDAAKKAQNAPKGSQDTASGDDETLAVQVSQAETASANAAARLSLIQSAISSIDAFTTTVNATGTSTRSPLAIASLNELFNKTEDGKGADGIAYVLSVKGLGGQSEEYTRNRPVGFDTFTTLADASVSFMLYDLAERKIIKSGIANGVSSVHGHLGEPPKGLIGPNAKDIIDDEAADDAAPSNGTEDEQGRPAEHRVSWWRRMF